MAYVLNEIYETKFLDCSYGFRTNRNCHQAIREINQTIMIKKVNYILDADIKRILRVRPCRLYSLVGGNPIR